MERRKDQDRRRYPRADVSFEIEYKRAREERKVKHSDAHDVSAGGISFFTREQFKKGDLLDVALHLKGFERTIVTRGQVVYSARARNGFLTAISFSSISYRDFIVILDYSLAYTDPDS